METRLWHLFCGILVTALLTGLTQATQAFTVPSGVYFQYPILRTTLFDQYSLDPSDVVILRPSLVSTPSLPAWLKFVQPLDTSDGYLYGTPSQDNVGQFNLEILALYSRTYESARSLLSLTVEENAETPAYLATFFISNQNFADLLDSQVQQDFRTAVDSAWGQGSEVVIQSMTSASDLGLRIPLNPDPNQKFGVQIVIGSNERSEALTSVIAEAASPCQQGGSYTPSSINGLFQPTFIVDWCQLTMTSGSASESPALNESAIYLGGTYNPPAMPVEESGRFFEFILLVVVPCAIMFLVILVLGYLMCCGRRSRKNPDSSSELQLTHHRILRQASRELRTLSNRRDGSASVATLTPIGTPTVGSQRPHTRSRGYDEYPWASTPQVNHRGMATPPPYRTPPHPHKHRETTFGNQSSDKRRLSEPSNARGEDLESIHPAPPSMGSSMSERNVRQR